ncbi:MAG TPA: 8-amino-7-oxononanoate synthase, partial [Spirochaetia bacterium]|nr:8-amino-7-oxononanoate synthase [Spirochaetia bacterium]
MNSKYECYISDEIEKLTSKSRFRTLQKNSEYRVNLSSNDYLSIAKNQSFIEEFNHTVTKKDYYTSSSSRLLTGNSLYYELVEEQLNVLFGKQSLVFNSGYHANLGIIPAVAGRKDIIFSDRLNHASIIDGCLLSGATIVR